MLSILKYKKRYERSFHLNTITSVALNSQGSIFAAGSLDGNVSVWAVDTGSALHRINARTPVHSLVWSTDVEGFVFGCENGVLVSVLLEEVCIRTVYFHAHSGPISCISPRSNNNLLISGATNEVSVWKRSRHPATREEIWEAYKTIPQPPAQYSQTGQAVKVTSVNWLHRHKSHDGGQRLIVSSYLWHGVMCWDLTSLAIMWRLAIPDCSSFSLSPDGSLAATYGTEDIFEVHNLVTGHLIQALPREATKARSKSPIGKLASPPVTFAHDSFAIITGGRGTTCIWDAECGDKLQMLDHGIRDVTAITAYSSKLADRFLIVTGVSEGTSSRIVLWDTVSHVNRDTEATTVTQDNVTRNLSSSWPIWMMIGLAVLSSWTWIAPT